MGQGPQSIKPLIARVEPDCLAIIDNRASVVALIGIGHASISVSHCIFRAQAERFVIVGDGAREGTLSAIGVAAIMTSLRKCQRIQPPRPYQRSTRSYTCGGRGLRSYTAALRNLLIEVLGGER